MALVHTEWPSIPVPSIIRELLATFFKVGDSQSPDAARELAECVFASDGRIQVNDKVIDGGEAISQSNHGLLSGLQSRRHEVHKVYGCNQAADDLMLIGRVVWTFKDGQTKDGGFAARAVIESQDGAAKLKLYQGWADLSVLMAKLGEVNK